MPRESQAAVLLSSQQRPHHAVATLYEDWFSRHAKAVKTLKENQQQHSNESSSNDEENDDDSMQQQRQQRLALASSKALVARSGLQGVLQCAALVKENALSATLLEHCRLELAATATDAGQQEVKIYRSHHHHHQQQSAKKTAIMKSNQKANKNYKMEVVDLDAFFEACPEFMQDSDSDEDDDESDQEDECVVVKQQHNTTRIDRKKKKKKPSPTTRNNDNGDNGSHRIVSAASDVSSNPYNAHQSTEDNSSSNSHGTSSASASVSHHYQQQPQHQQVQPQPPPPPQQRQRPSSRTSNPSSGPAAADALVGGNGNNGAFSYTPIDLVEDDNSNNNNNEISGYNGSTSRINPYAPPPSQQQQQPQQQQPNQYSSRPQQQQQPAAASRASFPPPHANAPYNNNNNHQQQWQSGASSWHDHQSQNPFQTAREYARAGGVSGGNNNGHDDYVQQDRNVPQQQSRLTIARPAPPPLPPPNNSNISVVGGYNPYAQQNQQQHQQKQQQSSLPHHLSSSSPAPPAPVIRDSLRRKFQPPTMKRANGNSNNSTNNGVVARRPNSSSGRPNSSSGGASSRNNANSTGGRNHNAKTGGSGNISSKKDSSKDGDDNDDDELPEELKRFGKDLVEKIENEIMDGPGESITFDDIAGLDDAKQTIQEVICWPMKRPDLFTGLRRAPNGLLLYGPPGTGKTLIGKAIAHESGATFFSISSSSLTSKWIGEGEKLVRTLFAVAAYREPAVVFIDEIDSLLTQRKADENEASRRIKTEFLVQLDGATTHAGDGSDGQEPVRQRRVLTIGATNRPQELDEAARRRFVKRLYIPLPEEADREVLLHVMLKKNNHRLTDQDVHKMAKETKGFSGADLKALCTDAAMGPIRQLGARALEINVADVPPIAFKHFRQSLRGMKPSVAPSDLIQYEEWDKIYGSKRADDEDENFDDDDDEEEESTNRDGEAS